MRKGPWYDTFVNEARTIQAGLVKINEINAAQKTATFAISPMTLFQLTTFTCSVSDIILAGE